MQALLPEAIIPLTFLQPSGQALLCGDPRFGANPLFKFDCAAAVQEYLQSDRKIARIHISVGQVRIQSYR